MQSLLEEADPQSLYPLFDFQPSILRRELAINTFIGGVIYRVLNYLACGYSIYYFIALIIECYLLAPVLVRNNNVRTLTIVATFSVSATLLIEFVRFIAGIELPLNIRGSFPPLLIFFYLGIFLSKHGRNYSLWLPAAMIVVGMAVGMLQTGYLYQLDVAYYGQKVSLYLFDAGMILLLMSSKIESNYRSNAFTRPILLCGEISFGIYFLHIYVIRYLNAYMPSLLNDWLLSTLLTLIITTAIILPIRRLWPQKAEKYLGFR